MYAENIPRRYLKFVLEKTLQNSGLDLSKLSELKNVVPIVLLITRNIDNSIKVMFKIIIYKRKNDKASDM